MRFKRGSKVEVKNTKKLVTNQEIGQVVEVFDESSWKAATILKVLDRDYYLVRQAGCVKELCVHRSNSRVVQCWQDEEQDCIVKGSGLCRRPDQLSALKPSKKVSKVPSFSARNTFHVGDDHISSSLLLNRVSQVALSKNETFRNIQNLEATDRAFKRRKVVPSALQGQVNVSPKCKENITDEKYRSGSVGYFLTRASSDSHSDSCSVGSCSINDKFSNLSPEEVCSDAESFQDSADKEERRSLSSPEKIAASIHSLELHAYRCTLEALYASGPLSWDQEALLTNLRISLHISNDEHLAELKTLISAGTGQQLDVYILCLQKSKDDA